MSHRVVFAVLAGIFLAVFAAAAAVPLLAPDVPLSPAALAHAGLLALAFGLLAMWTPSSQGQAQPEACPACGRALVGGLSFCAACGTETAPPGTTGRDSRAYRA